MDEEEVNRFGEFICSYNVWLPIEVQKEQAKRMENMTNRKKDAK